MTLASHARGPVFESRLVYAFFNFFISHINILKHIAKIFGGPEAGWSGGALPEWSRGSPAKRVCIARTGSNPVGVERPSFLHVVGRRPACVVVGRARVVKRRQRCRLDGRAVQGASLRH